MPGRSDVAHRCNLIIQRDKNLSLFVSFPGEKPGLFPAPPLFLKSPAQQEPSVRLAASKQLWKLKTDPHVKPVTSSVSILPFEILQNLNSAIKKWKHLQNPEG